MYAMRCFFLLLSYACGTSKKTLQKKLRRTCSNGPTRSHYYTLIETTASSLSELPNLARILQPMGSTQVTRGFQIGYLQENSHTSTHSYPPKLSSTTSSILKAYAHL